MSRWKKDLGEQGEDLALNYLQQKGYQLITRNFHSRFGEIDLIMQEKDDIVFVEVKTRTNRTFGTPLQSITPAKIQSLIKTVQYYKHLNPRSPDCQRIDIVTVEFDQNKQDLKVSQHIKNIT